MIFKEFNKLLAQHVLSMSEGEQYLFEVDVGRDELWEMYLESFPPEMNPIFRERREFDCSCCRHFIRAFGNVVAIKDNKVVSIWDFEVGDSGYQKVVDALAALVKSKFIKSDYTCVKCDATAKVYSVDSKGDYVVNLCPSCRKDSICPESEEKQLSTLEVLMLENAQLIKEAIEYDKRRREAMSKVEEWRERYHREKEISDFLKSQTDDLTKGLAKSMMENVDEEWIESMQTSLIKLATFIAENVEGEPSRPESAIDCAIRIIKNLMNENRRMTGQGPLIVNIDGEASSNAKIKMKE